MNSRFDCKTKGQANKQLVLPSPNPQANQTTVPTKQKLGGMLVSMMLRSSVKSLDLRACYYDKSADPSSRHYNEHCIFVFWHEYIFPLLPQWANCPLTLLVSQHRDAEWLNQAAIRMGYDIVRGSTNRGGSGAIRELKRFSKKSSFAITPDGPRGPRRHMAMGPIFLASLFNMPIVPVGVGCNKPWRMNTWDKFAIPRPFSRTRVVFGPKIYLPRKKRNAHEDFRVRVESLIHKLTDCAESWATDGNRMVGQRILGGEPWSRQAADFAAMESHSSLRTSPNSRSKTTCDKPEVPFNHSDKRRTAA